MEHEVYVPFSAGRVRAALADRELVARCVPGLQRDAADGGPEGGGELGGRLRVRIAGSTITYRGALTVTPEGDGFRVHGTGSEVRGSGTAELSLTLTPRPSQDGTRLVVRGGAGGDGRLGDVEEKPAHTAGRRMLERFVKALTENLGEQAAQASESSDGSGGIGDPDDNEPAIPGIPGPESGEEDARSEQDKPGKPEDAPSAEAEGDGPEGAAPEDGAHATGEDVTPLGGPDVPRPTPDEPAREPDEERERLTAEAAHARRTMIGRSEEEVDHAPPRGRYAPVPVPQPAVAAATLRWAAPAAAVAVAGAVVLSRFLRRRR